MTFKSANPAMGENNTPQTSMFGLHLGFMSKTFSLGLDLETHSLGLGIGLATQDLLVFLTSLSQTP